VQAGLIEQHGTRRWADYTLKVSVETKQRHTKQTDEDKILEYVRQNGSINNTECRDLLKIGLKRASYLLNKMNTLCILDQIGKRRWARYTLPQNAK
jgi:predicted HTH transcriptional regulator